jgi:prophage maintenance system killer protein
MSGGPPLAAADLRLIHRVAARRRGEPAAALDPAALVAVLAGMEEAAGPGPARIFERAARLTGGVAALIPGPLGRQTALLALLCQLRLDGYQLTAPQGVLAAMVMRAAERPAEWEALARWLEDRSLVHGAPGPGVGW